MILSHYLFNSPIDFDDFRIHRLVFENPADMGAIVNELREQTKGFEGRFILYESGKEIDCSRALELVVDPFSVDLNSKEILAGFHKVVSKELETGDDYLDYREAICDLLRVVSMVSSEVESNATMEDLSTQSIIKSVSLGITEENDLCARICEYTRLVSRYTGKMLIVMVNVASFMSTESYNDCIRQLSYLQVPVLLIESSSKKDAIPTKLFDADFCEIDL